MKIPGIDGLGDTPDAQLLEGDTEHELRVVKAEVKVSQRSNNPYLNLTLEPVDEPTADVIFDIASLPNAEDDERKRLFKRRMLKNLMQALDLDPDALEDTDQMEGATGYAIIGVEDDGEHPKRNVVKRWVVPAG